MTTDRDWQAEILASEGITNGGVEIAGVNPLERYREDYAAAQSACARHEEKCTALARG